MAKKTETPETGPKKEAIRYKGSVGRYASTDVGGWETGQVRNVGDEADQVPMSYAGPLVDSGSFEWAPRVEPPAPEPLAEPPQ